MVGNLINIKGMLERYFTGLLMVRDGTMYSDDKLLTTMRSATVWY